MLFSTDIKNIGEATVAYLASFYLLDFDYPKSCEVGLCILQRITFQDENIPKDITTSFESALKSFNSFKKCMKLLISYCMLFPQIEFPYTIACYCYSYIRFYCISKYNILIYLLHCKKILIFFLCYTVCCYVLCTFDSFQKIFFLQEKYLENIYRENIS